MKDNKIAFQKANKELKVKEKIKDAKAKGYIKSLKDAFKTNPTSKEVHKGNANYF